MPQRTCPADAVRQCQYDRPEEGHLPGRDNLKGAVGWIQGVNAQAVDSDHKFIVTIGVSNQASDDVHLLHMMGELRLLRAQYRTL